ncbi:MAG: type II secretion system F family protein [Candidatus Acidiferrales bacterium]
MTTAVIFFAVLAVGAIVYLSFAPSGDVLDARLSQLWSPASPVGGATTFAEKQLQRLERALGGLGQLLPSSGKKLSRTVRLMLRAGFRSPEAVKIFQGFRVLLPPVLMAAVYFTHLFVWNPPFVFGFAGAAGFLLPDFWLSWRVKRRQRRLVRGLPDALDLLVVCVEAGMGLDQAIYRVARELRIAHADLSDELQLVNLEMRVGKSRPDSLRELGVRTGVEDIKSFAVMLIQADRFGTDLAQSLRVHSDNLRTKRRQRAEESAAKTSVKMVPALVFFIFPALFAVLLGPAVISLLREFHAAGSGL